MLPDTRFLIPLMVSEMVFDFIKICLRHAHRPATAIALLVLLSGCASLSGLNTLMTSGTAIAPDPFVAVESESAAPKHVSATTAAASSPQPPLSDEVALTTPSAPASAGTVQMASFVPESANRGPAASRQAQPASRPAAFKTSFHEAIPRLPSLYHDETTEEPAMYAGSPLAQAYPDEYIFDGGDRHHPVHYYGGEMQGLDTEDTVAEYKDHLGRNAIEPSNRVAIYAPRFGAVQSVSGLNRSVKVDKAVGAENYRGFEALHHDRGLETNVRNSTATGLAVRRRVSGFETAEGAHRSSKLEGIVQTEKVDQGLQAWSRTGLGSVETSAIFELNLQIQMAVSSTAETVPGSRSSTQQATSTYSTFKPAAVVGLDRDAPPGRIVLTKEASQLVAAAGDEITFTIRFRNPGKLPVHDVKIIDHLTPRLVYVEGSGELNVAGSAGGGLVVIPNQEGSQQLIFELDEPLRGGESGTITFVAVVR